MVRQHERRLFLPGVRLSSDLPRDDDRRSASADLAEPARPERDVGYPKAQ